MLGRFCLITPGQSLRVVRLPSILVNLELTCSSSVLLVKCCVPNCAKYDYADLVASFVYHLDISGSFLIHDINQIHESALIDEQSECLDRFLRVKVAAIV